MFKLILIILGKDSPDESNEDEEPTARRVLKNCLLLLDRQKYPQIAASASFLLADIYIPDTLNPQNPEFEPKSEKLDLNARQHQPETEPKKKASKKRRAKNKNRSEQKKAPDTNPNGESVTVDELRDNELPSFDPQVLKHSSI